MGEIRRVAPGTAPRIVDCLHRVPVEDASIIGGFFRELAFLGNVAVVFLAPLNMDNLEPVSLTD